MQPFYNGLEQMRNLVIIREKVPGEIVSLKAVGYKNLKFRMQPDTGMILEKKRRSDVSSLCEVWISKKSCPMRTIGLLQKLTFTQAFE